MRDPDVVVVVGGPVLDISAATPAVPSSVVTVLVGATGDLLKLSLVFEGRFISTTGVYNGVIKLC